jgi:hypothetical protein
MIKSVLRMVELKPEIKIDNTRPFFVLNDLPTQKTIESAADDTATAGPGNYHVRCRVCGHIITHAQKGITVSGSHTHTYFNPNGIAFEIGCFSEAPGVRVEGPPSREFSWFGGHAWRYVLCANCHEHLGWQFIGDAGGDFFGLIWANLVEEG